MPRVRSSVVVPWLAGAVACVGVQAWAQSTIAPTRESLRSDRPEAWAMRYLGASTLMTSLGQEASTRTAAPWSWTIAGDLAHIPRLSTRQQVVGFNGTKGEDLNKTDVFGRVRLGLVAPGGWLLEVGYTPPIESRGAKPRNMIAVGLGGTVVDRGPWRLFTRMHGQTGSVRGDITCPARLAGVADPLVNPAVCQAPSDDRFDVDHVGADLGTAYRAGPWQVHGTLGVVRTDYRVQVNALTGGTLDRTRLVSRGSYAHVALGARHEISRAFSLGGEVLAVPLSVRRGVGASRENDPLWSLRLQLRYTLPN
jgi:hypothetical protein